MDDISGGVNWVVETVTNILLFLTNGLAGMVRGIGFVEIFVILLIGCAIWVWFIQHDLEPKRVARF